MPVVGIASWISSPRKTLTLESGLVREELYMEEHTGLPGRGIHSHFMNRLMAVRAYQRSEAKIQTVKQRKRYCLDINT